jgi:hypothetical protein
LVIEIPKYSINHAKENHWCTKMMFIGPETCNC